MSELEDLYAQISQDKKLVRKWQREANKRIKRFVKNIAGASPFLDKPVKRMFGVRNSKDGQSLTIYGTSPNAGRMKGFNAPVNEWRQTTEAFRIFGEGGWRTIHKVQMVNTSACVPIQDVPYFGTSEKPLPNVFISSASSGVNISSSALVQAVKTIKVSTKSNNLL